MTVKLHSRIENKYYISQCDINFFHEFGYLTLPQILLPHELNELESWFDHFIQGKEKQQMRNDFYDSAKPLVPLLSHSQLITAILPSQYCSELKDNIFFKLAQFITDQLYDSGKTGLDFECFRAKKSNKSHTEYAMHQDLGTWPKTKKTWTATFSLALSDATLHSGCLQVVPNSNYERRLRKHQPQIGNNPTMYDRHYSPPLVSRSLPHDKIVHLPVKRGDITIHNERIVHGSSGDSNPEWQKTYLMSFRDLDTIEEERAMGFSHSKNNPTNQEILENGTK